MEVIEPALGDLFGPDPAQHFITHLVADGRGDRDVAIGRFGDPVEPVVEHPDQPRIAKLWMGQGDQVVDDRHDSHAIALELFGQREKIGMPGRVQQHQLIAWLVLKRFAARRNFLAFQTVIENPDWHTQGSKRREPTTDIQHAASKTGLAKRLASFQRAVHQPELVGDLFQAHAQAHQVQLGHRQWRQACDFVQSSIEHHHRNAFQCRMLFRQLGDDIANHTLDPGVSLWVFEHIGAFNQHSRHGAISGAMGSTGVCDEREMLVCASSHEQPTKSSWRLLITWNTSP
ncbi:hypothetical protein D3C73_910620 [compost metagenome]